MTFLRTLRTRIIVGFVIFGLVLSITLATTVYVGFHKIENIVIRDAMRAEMERIQSESTAPDAPVAVIRTWSVPLRELDELPGPFRTFAPGYHRLEDGRHHYMVLVQDRGAQRYVVSYDEQQVFERERYWIFGLAASVALALGLSTWAGRSLAGQVIRPVTQLTAEIQALESKRDVGGELQGYADDEIGSLARAFQDYRERFQAMMQREQEFAGNVSHELRTPVTSINLAVEVLAEDPNLTDIQRYRLSRIRRAGREMSEMLNTFLLLSRHEDAAGEDLEDCNVNQTVREVMENQSVWIGDKPVSTRLVEDAQLTVRAPHGVVAVLIGNVVRNAYRFTKSGVVSVRITDDRVIVEDTGPGIDTDTRAHLFERHVHGTSDDHGTGLGLSIVKRLSERYGWHIEVRSAAGSGTRFDIIMRPS